MPLGSAIEQAQSHREGFPGTQGGMASHQLHHPSDEGEMKVSGDGHPSAPLELGAHALLGRGAEARCFLPHLPCLSCWQRLWGFLWQNETQKSGTANKYHLFSPASSALSTKTGTFLGTSWLSSPWALVHPNPGVAVSPWQLWEVTDIRRREDWHWQFNYSTAAHGSGLSIKWPLSLALSSGSFCPAKQSISPFRTRTRRSRPAVVSQLVLGLEWDLIFGMDILEIRCPCSPASGVPKKEKERAGSFSNFRKCQLIFSGGF